MGQYYNVKIPDGVKLLYDMSNPISYNRTDTNWYNLVGNNTLVFDGAPIFGSAGASSYVFFTGADGANNASTATGLRVQGPLTVSFLCASQSIGLRQTFMELSDSTSTNTLKYGYASPNDLRPTFFKGASGTGTTIVTHSIVGLGTVVNVTYSVDGSNNSKVYINGILDNTSSIVTASGDITKIFFGYNSAFTEAASGALYWVGMWGRVLAPKEVEQIWHQLKSKWGFSGVAGTTAGTGGGISVGQTVPDIVTQSTQTFTNEYFTNSYYHWNKSISNAWISSVSTVTNVGSATTVYIPMYMNESANITSVLWGRNSVASAGNTEPLIIGICENSSSTNIFPNPSSMRSITASETPKSTSATRAIIETTLSSSCAVTAGNTYWFTISGYGRTQSHVVYLYYNVFEDPKGSWNTITASSGVFTTNETQKGNVGFASSTGKIYYDVIPFQYSVQINPYPLALNQEYGISLYIPQNHPSMRLADINWMFNAFAGTMYTHYVVIRDSLANQLSAQTFDFRNTGETVGTASCNIELTSPYYLNPGNIYYITFAGDGSTYLLTNAPQLAGNGITKFIDGAGNGMTYQYVTYTSGIGYSVIGSRITPFNLRFDKIGFNFSNATRIQ